jgi:hypothetical protein
MVQAMSGRLAGSQRQPYPSKAHALVATLADLLRGHRAGRAAAFALHLRRVTAAGTVRHFFTTSDLIAAGRLVVPNSREQPVDSPLRPRNTI